MGYYPDKYIYHSNLLIVAGYTLYTSLGRDTTIAGAHLEGDKVWVDIGRDLTVASLQDHYDSKNFSWSVGADVTVGYGVMVNGNVGFGQGKATSDWVGQQTSIVGRSDVDIYVENNTHIKGGIIATNPGGTLVLNTDTLTFESIKDTDKGEDFGINLSGGFSVGGVGFDKGAEGDTFKPYDYTSNGGTDAGPKDYLPDSGEITYASHNKEGILRPTVTEGDIIVRSNPDAATDGTLGGLNRDLDRAREVTKDDKAYMDFYVSKQGIEELLDGFGGVVQGFEDLSENSKKILSGIDLAIAGYPEEVQAFGEAYKVAYKNMLLNGVSEEVALQVIANPEFQSHLATTTDLSKYSSMTDKIGSEGANVQYYIDPVTGQVKTRVIVTLENTVGRELYNELANFKLFIDSIPYENERTAILYGIQIALGGPIKTLISEVKDLFVNSFFKEAKDAIIENSYVFATTGLSKNEYLNTFVDVGPSLQAEFNQDIKDNARPVELGFAIVGIAGSIKSLQKGKGVKTD